MTSVLVVGDINADIMAPVHAYPSKGGESISRRSELHAGGSAANTAIVLAKFGIDVALLGRVGTDPLADLVLTELDRGGVDLTMIQRDPHVLTGTMFIPVTPDGEHTIFGDRGANVNLDQPSLPDLDGLDVRWMHISGYTLLEDPQRKTVLQVLKDAVRRDVRVSLDVGLWAAYKARDEIRRLLRQVDVLFPNLEEARVISGRTGIEEVIESLLVEGVDIVVLKLGADGCVVADRTKSSRVSSFNIDVVDTTGAGDSFDAGFILGRLWQLGPRESALLANALGGLACAHLGAGEHLPAPKETRELLRRSLVDPSWRNWERELGSVLKVLDRATRQTKPEP